MSPKPFKGWEWLSYDPGTISTEAIVQYCALKCARRIEKIADLVPMEVEALLRELMLDRSLARQQVAELMTRVPPSPQETEPRG